MGLANSDQLLEATTSHFAGSNSVQPASEDDWFSGAASSFEVQHHPTMCGICLMRHGLRASLCANTFGNATAAILSAI